MTLNFWVRVNQIGQVVPYYGQYIFNSFVDVPRDVNDYLSTKKVSICPNRLLTMLLVKDTIGGWRNEIVRLINHKDLSLRIEDA